MQRQPQHKSNSSKNSSNGIPAGSINFLVASGAAVRAGNVDVGLAAMVGAIVVLDRDSDLARRWEGPASVSLSASGCENLADNQVLSHRTHQLSEAQGSRHHLG